MNRRQIKVRNLQSLPQFGLPFLWVLNAFCTQQHLISLQQSRQRNRLGTMTMTVWQWQAKIKISGGKKTAVTFEQAASSFLYRLGHTSRSLKLIASTDAWSLRYLHRWKQEASGFLLHKPSATGCLINMNTHLYILRWQDLPWCHTVNG
jgi:hypothetical protein